MKDFALFGRAFKEILQTGKQLYFLTFVNALFEKSIPFINILYMSRVLQQLTVGDYELVVRSIVEYLIIFACLQIGTSILAPINEEKQFLLRREIEQKPYEKMMRMSFHYADQAETHEKVHHIGRDMMQNNSSMSTISFHIANFIEQSVPFIWSVILLLPLWRRSETIALDGWNWVNSQWLNIGLVFLIIGTVLLQMKVMQKVYDQLRESSDEIRHVNALYFYIYQKLPDAESGKEIRLYNLSGSIDEITENHAEFIGEFFSNYYKVTGQAKIIGTVLSQALTLVFYALIGIRVLIGSLPIGLLIQLSGALSQLITTLPQLMTFTSVFSQTAPLERYYDLMDYPEEEVKGSLPVEKRLDNDYTLSVKDMSFVYPNAEERTLKNINQSFEVGKKYAIVGENGSGKTTFIKVLMRLYEPSDGQIRLNLIEAGKYHLSEYYQLFGVVFQDYRLLSFKLGQNIAVSQEYDKDLSLSIINEVGLDNLLQKLPAGLETYLGKEFEESGVNLSGGQAQKVAIARALYKDAPIMILDEPTAALDPSAEFEIYQKFSEITEDKTAFYISHRLSSCRFCDEVLVFDKGEIIQRGSHDELVNQGGKYNELWHAQAQYYA